MQWPAQLLITVGALLLLLEVRQFLFCICPFQRLSSCRRWWRRARGPGDDSSAIDRQVPEAVDSSRKERIMAGTWHCRLVMTMGLLLSACFRGWLSSAIWISLPPDMAQLLLYHTHLVILAVTSRALWITIEFLDSIYCMIGL